MRRRAFVRLLAVTPFAPSAPIWRRLGFSGAIAEQTGALSQLRQDIPALKVVSSYAPAKTPGMPGPYPGRVVSISSAAEFTPRAALTEEEQANLVFGVKLVLAKSGGALKAGLPADVRIASAP